MIQFIIERPGPYQFVLDRSTKTLAVSIQQRVMQINLERAVVVIAPAGQAPAPGSGKTGHLHTQATPAADWLIQHDLGYNPGGIQAFDSAGGQWFPNVSYPDLNHVHLNFGTSSFAGKAYLS